MLYKLIATDMDGTLLNSKSELSPRTKEAIIKTVETGVLFVVATGRAMQGVRIVDELFDADLPFIVFNGAAAVMGKSGEVLFDKFLDAGLAKEVYETGIGLGIPIALWTKKTLWLSSLQEATSRYRKYYDMDTKIIESIDELSGEGIYKVLWFETPENIKRLQHEMNGHFGGRLNCHASLPHLLEFVSPDADKGSALAEIGRLYGIGAGEMLAVGDSYNDISMLKYAGLGIAMENAPDDVKAVCKRVTLSNDDDGVAAVIYKYLQF